MNAKFVEWLLENQLVPDSIIRANIRSRCLRTLRAEKLGGEEAWTERKKKLVEFLRQSPIAVHTQAANEQHYEVPTKFYELSLGKRLKYSGGYWPDGVTTLDDSEDAMLALSCQRAELANGQRILELGCGWGSLTLFMAEKFPGSKIIAVSNSRTQKMHIDAQAATRGLKNVEIITADMNTFAAPGVFDRVVSVEMFEHMRNYHELLKRISTWLVPTGKLFVHIFTHKQIAYLFDEADPNDFIGKYFFTGGTMPSHDLLFHFNEYMKKEKDWIVDGTHYERTSNAWLETMDSHRAEIMPIFKTVYGKDANKWWAYWRVFFMACAELFGYDKGGEWIVSHYLFTKVAA